MRLRAPRPPRLCRTGVEDVVTPSMVPIVLLRRQRLLASKYNDRSTSCGGSMRYTTFGRRTGLRVSEYALGAGNFGTRWGTGAERPEAQKIFDRFAEAGGTFIDTADGYQVGE